MPPASKVPLRVPLALDLIERIIVAVFYSFMWWSFLGPWQETGNIICLMLLVSEGSVVAFVLVRRFASEASQRPVDWLVAFSATIAPLLIRPMEGEALVSLVFCVILMSAGITLQIAAKLSLRRSFGVVAANRGVKRGGPYRIVRHPMYAGYFMTHFAFLLAHPSTWNATIYAFAFVLQISRIFIEERMLSRDPAYCAFAAAVPYRLAPGIF